MKARKEAGRTSAKGAARQERGTVPWIDLRRQYLAVQDEVDGAVRRVLDSVRYVNGPEAEAFEREWAGYCGTRYCVAVGSGTAALYLTLKALGIGPGDEVITVGFTVSATLDAISELGATPVLVDVEEATYTLDAALLAARVTARTRAILPVHVYGHPADMEPLLAFAAERGLPVVQDACEAHGALYKGTQVASLGSACCFSFYPTKNLGALGDAGAVVTDDATLAERLRLLRQHGWDRRYHSVAVSLNSRMDEIQAAVLRAKLPHLDAWNERRRQIARLYDRALEGAVVRPAPAAAWASPSYYFYVARCEARDHARRLLADAGIATDVSWPEPPHLQPAYSHLGYGPGSLPVTERLCREVFSIPMFPDLSEEEIERVCRALRAVSLSSPSFS